MNKKTKPTPTVKKLRQRGYKVRIQRFRPYFLGDAVVFLDDNNARINGLTKDEVFQRGGVTIASIRKPNGAEVRGESVCSLDDPFVKQAGVEIAIARALNLPVPQH